MLQQVVGVLVATAGLALLVWAFRRAGMVPVARLPADVVVRAQLLTDTERRFFERLRRLLPHHQVLAQVSLGALLRARVPETSPAFWRVYRSFGMKIADFVLCEPKRMLPVLVIELDDPSHDGKRSRDAERDRLLARAGLKTVRVDVRENLGDEALRARLLAALHDGRARLNIDHGSQLW